MSEVKVRITAQNETQTGFQSVLSDAKKTASEVKKTFSQATTAPRVMQPQQAAGGGKPFSFEDFYDDAISKAEQQIEANLAKRKQAREAAAQAEKAANADTGNSIMGLVGRFALLAGAAIAVGKAISAGLERIGSAFQAAAEQSKQFSNALQTAGTATSLDGAISGFKNLNAITQQTQATLDELQGKNVGQAVSNLFQGRPGQVFARAASLVGVPGANDLQDQIDQQRQSARDAFAGSMARQATNAEALLGAGGNTNAIRNLQSQQQDANALEDLKNALKGQDQTFIEKQIESLKRRQSAEAALTEQIKARSAADAAAAIRQQNADNSRSLVERLAREKQGLADLQGFAGPQIELQTEQAKARIADLEKSIAQIAAKEISVAVQTTELDSAEEAIAALQNQKNITVALEALGVESIEEARAKLDSVNGTSVALTLQALGVATIDEARAKLESADGKDIALTFQALGVSSIEEAKAKLDAAQGKDVALTLQTLGVSTIEEAKTKLDSASSREAALVLQALGTADIDAAKAKLDELQQGSAATAVLQVTGLPDIEAAKAALDKFQGKTVPLSVDDTDVPEEKTVALIMQALGTEDIDAAKAKLDALQSKDIALTLQALGVQTIDEAKAKLDSADGKTVQIVLEALNTNSIDEALAKLRTLDASAREAIANIQKSQNAALSQQASAMRAANAETAATQGMSDEQLLARQQEKLAALNSRAMETGRFSNADQVEREQIAASILSLEERIKRTREQAIKSAKDVAESRAFDAMSPAERQAELDRQMAQFQSGLASGALTPQAASEQAARLMQMFDATNQAPAGFQGSAGASAFQRIGFASNEFFDTRTTPDPTKDTKRAADFAKQIYDLLKKGEPLVLNPTNS